MGAKDSGAIHGDLRHGVLASRLPAVHSVFRFGIRKGLLMARINRREVLADGEIQVVHCVDLNRVRAGIAATPESSDFTSAQKRIADLKSADEVSTADAKDARIEHRESAGWLAPVELEPKRKKVREKCSSRRASNCIASKSTRLTCNSV